MPLLEDLGVDITTAVASEIEEQMKAGPIPAEGLHHAVLEGFREGAANNGRKFAELTFKIVAGPSRSQTVKESLWASDDQKGKNRVTLFAHRLGLLTKVNDKYAKIPGKDDFSSVIGAQCVIDIKHKDREYEAKNGEKKKTTDAILSFEGVLPLDDPRCKNVPKGTGAALAVNKAAGGGGGKPADTFSDL